MFSGKKLTFLHFIDISVRERLRYLHCSIRSPSPIIHNSPHRTYMFPVRGLCNKLYEKRKSTAYEVEQLIRIKLEDEDEEGINEVIRQLSNDFIYSPSRSTYAAFGGLIGLAAVGIALGFKIATFLESILLPVLYCLNDTDSKIRYYACESLYNIGKVAKGELFRFFNPIFDALSKLSADQELTVKNGAELLDRLIKDIVLQQAATYISCVDDQSSTHTYEPPVSEVQDVPVLGREPTRSGTFSIASVIPLFAERIYVLNPNTRMFLVSWIQLLDSIPDLEFITYVPTLLDGLLNYLNDPNEGVRVATSNCLANFLAEIQKVAKVKYYFFEKDEERKPNYFEDLKKKVLLESMSPELIEYVENSIREGSYILEAHVEVNYHKILTVLLERLKSGVPLIQITVLSWMSELLRISPQDFITLIPDILREVFPLFSSVGNVAQLARDLAQNLAGFCTKILDLEVSDPKALGPEVDRIDLDAVIDVLKELLTNENEETRVKSLEWIIMFKKKANGKIIDVDDPAFKAFLRRLSDSSDLVVSKNLELLSHIAISQKGANLKHFLKSLLSMFAEDREFLDNRSAFIIRQLCVNINGEKVYRGFAEILEKEEDQSFFVCLYRAWCHNPVALFSLCLIAQAYELAANLLTVFGEIEMNMQILIQLDKLIQLIESPVFTSMRLQLLEPDRYPSLIKALYGVLMLLPQSSAFRTLRERLQCVFPLRSGMSISKDRFNRGNRDDQNSIELLECFRHTQNKHQITIREKNKGRLALPVALTPNPTATTTSTPTSASGITTNTAPVSSIFANLAPVGGSAVGRKKKL
ncbi:vacuolar protein [Schizosaccharomyces japonicus yFS275]|uniref:Vacuolar protein n=1 Tax=Schizosaccharomyces japonicus (strain yFS275 / FY16936) TaxID=402676 RepID=B6K048_SCHJY|nr:vacuolar protein [Schizosaccharomyces japonicus yFS275]EEB06198.1 vacuolar protein [Schizosaccharomyces japonicus yFS275]